MDFQIIIPSLMGMEKLLQKVRQMICAADPNFSSPFMFESIRVERLKEPSFNYFSRRCERVAPYLRPRVIDSDQAISIQIFCK